MGTLFPALARASPGAWSAGMSLPQDTETAHWFASEVQPHEPELRRYLHGLAARDNVDDLVQETYFRLLRARLKRTVLLPRGLLFAIARNAARDIFRRDAVSKTTGVAEVAELDVVDDMAPDPHKVVTLRQETEILQAAIQSLPERCRTVLLLRKIQNLSHKEIADRMGISVHTVESQLTKALRRCQEYFEQQGAMPDKKGKTSR